MRSRIVVCRVAALMSGLFVASPMASARAQTVPVSAVPVRPATLSGLYRLETPSPDSRSIITFLRLLPDVVVGSSCSASMTSARLYGQW